MRHSGEQREVDQDTNNAADRQRADAGELLGRYVHRSACAATAGMGAFGLVSTSQAAITVVTPSDTFLQRSLVGNPYGSNPIESIANPGTYPFASTGWATAGFLYQYGGYYYPTGGAFGIDLDGNGTGDINFFRGQGYAGYLVARTDVVGYVYGNVPGSGQADLLSNDADNPDSSGTPYNYPYNGRQALQGFNAGELIGDGNDTVIDTSGGPVQGIMRNAYEIGDWDGVDDNYENLYPNPGGSSYVGFQIDGLATGTGSGFGWIEVIVREGTVPGFTNPSHPELQIIRWAFTDDGTPIAAGDTGPMIDADFDNDGDTDVNDLLTLQRGFGVGTTNADGDTNGDMVVDATDLANTEAAFGDGEALAAIGAVPEPTTLGLLAAGAGGLALPRRRRKRS